MNYEKQSGVSARRPLPTVSTYGSRLPERSALQPKAQVFPSSNGIPVRRKENVFEKFGAREGYNEDLVATPVKPYLSSNITPRSGSRKARAETASPSPHNTPREIPSNSRPVSSKGHYEANGEHGPAKIGSGLRMADEESRPRAGSAVSDMLGPLSPSYPAREDRDSTPNRATSPENTSKFFHANDIRPNSFSRNSPERSIPRIPGYQQQEEETINNSCGRASFTSHDSTSDTQYMQTPDFIYANDSTESHTFSPRLGQGDTPSRPTLQTIYSAHAAETPSRAPSPLKDEVLPPRTSMSKASPRRHTRLVSNGGTGIKKPESTTYNDGNLSRKSSLTSPRRSATQSHKRSSSVQSADPSPPRRSSTAVAESSTWEHARNQSLVGTIGEIPQSVNSSAIIQEPPQSPLAPPPRSPTKFVGGGQSKLEQMNELAANARRERKVLDLEISNSSLLAINRTLEREMRKQTAELRRYRRLSRSGRMSIAPSRSASGNTFVIPGPEKNFDSDELLSASEDEEDLDELLSNLSTTSTKSQPSSSNGRAGRARFQDPARIQLDLDAHRALLIDSQKLNTSIKQCLSQSESLLSSARRALEYQGLPHIPENLGARVLTPDDDEDGVHGGGQGLLSPSVNPGGINPWERSLGRTGSLDAGSSTPDYSRWGPPTEQPTSSKEIGERPWDEGYIDEPIENILQASPVVKQIDEMEIPPATPPTPSPKDIPSHNTTEYLKPNLPSRRISDISIDGVEDSSDSEVSSDEEKTLQSFTERARTPEGRSILERNQVPKPPELTPGEAGYRGSMQGLGHYLQAFSIFGTKQEA